MKNRLLAIKSVFGPGASAPTRLYKGGKERSAAMAYRAARGGEGWRRGEVMPRWGEAVQAVLLLRRRRRPGRRLRGRVRSGGGPSAPARPLAPPLLPLL